MESSGVIAMIDLLIKDLATEMTTITAEEKNAQEDYEKFMSDSAEKRAADSKLIEEKEGAKAEMEAALQAMGEEKKSKSAEAVATMKYIENLHLECDWLVKNFELRKEARAGEGGAFWCRLLPAANRGKPIPSPFLAHKHPLSTFF